MSLRVLHCPDVVGGNPAGLAAAERELGFESTSVVLSPSPYGYAVDDVVWDDRDGVVVRELKRWRLLVHVLRDFDVVHFNFGSTIAPQRVVRDALEHERAASSRLRVWTAYAAVTEQVDLPLLKRADKAVFVTFQGDDARQGDVLDRFGSNVAAEAAPGHYSADSDRNKRRRISRFDQYADGIYALNPDLLHVLPERARFLPYSNVDPRAWEPAAPAGWGVPPLVLHMPTNREIKGTRFVLDAVSRLQAEGVALDFRLVEGVTRDEAKSLYRSADLVVDQLLVGWYGGLAVEAMALERPVVAYLREEDLGFVPPEMRAEIPVISAEPATIYDVLKELLTTRRGELAEMGRRGGEYVRRWHDPLRIAKELVADYEAAVVAHSS
jgi:glycosyltransferase involved in cell wall biosynthesis